MAVATPLVHVDCCPSNSSLPVAEHAHTKSPCHETCDQLARSSQASVAGPPAVSQNVAAGGSYLASSLVVPDTVPHIPSTPHNRQRCLTPCANDPFARARIAAAQSRVAAPTLSDPRPPPPGPTFSPNRDGRYWCSKCPRRGFATIPSLTRHFTTQHAGTQVDEPTRALLVVVERVTCTCTDPACGGFRRAGARTCSRCSQPTPARPPAIGDFMRFPSRGMHTGWPAPFYFEHLFYTCFLGIQISFLPRNCRTNEGPKLA